MKIDANGQTQVKWTDGTLKGAISTIDVKRAEAEIKAGNAEAYPKPKEVAKPKK
jgi:hypothetical protein